MGGEKGRKWRIRGDQNGLGFGGLSNQAHNISLTIRKEWRSIILITQRIEEKRGRCSESSEELLGDYVFIPPRPGIESAWSTIDPQLRTAGISPK